MSNAEPAERQPAHETVTGYRIEDCITIRASAERIWAELADFNRWADWSPLYAASKGELRPGNMLDMAIALPGMKPQAARSIVTAALAPSLIEYHTRAMGGLTKAYRYIEITPSGDGTCTVRNGEVMGGLVGPLLGRIAGEKVRQGVQGMNAALKQRAESPATP